MQRVGYRAGKSPVCVKKKSKKAHNFFVTKDILSSLTNLSVVIDDLFQVKSLRSYNNLVKIHGEYTPPNFTQRGGNRLPPPRLETA